MTTHVLKTHSVFEFLAFLTIWVSLVGFFVNSVFPCEFQEQLDLTLSMLKNASSHEVDDEEATILSMEDSSKEMGLLIEKKILDHDRRKDDLNDLNNKFLQALAMYQQFMKEPMVVQPPSQQLQQQQQMTSQQRMMTSHQHSLQYQAQQAYNYVCFLCVCQS